MKNVMGSEVKEGYKCKPKVLDKNKPMMHYKYILHICSDKRCGQKGSYNLANELREIVKELGFDRGENRIKIAKSFCYGACRYKQVANIFANSDTLVENNNIWLKGVDEYSKKEWVELFKNLVENKSISSSKKIKMQVF